VLHTQSGRLYYDADGSGSRDALLIATFFFPDALTADAITVI
jgi:hypothetical protein